MAFTIKTKPKEKSTILRILISVMVTILLLPQSSSGQYRDPQAGKTYSDYYRQNLKTSGRPSMSAANYTYNRIYKHNAAISPYVNLVRRQPIGKTTYQAYVKPEQQQRAAQSHTNTSYRPPSSSVNIPFQPTRPTKRANTRTSARTVYPTRTPTRSTGNSYYKKYYSNRR